MSRRMVATGLGSVLSMAILLGGAPSARASSPLSTWVVASKLDLLPNPQAATSVMIHGAFFFWSNGGQYTAPQCGFMYFTCPPGSEALCRMQWMDIVSLTQSNLCAGFGQMNMAPTATFYKPGDTPGKPDLWDLGMGVQAGGWVGGQCDPAKMLKCGGVAPPQDMAMPPARDLSVPPPPADLSSSPALDMAKGPPPDDLAVAPPPPDLSQKPSVAPPSSSCTIGGGGAVPWSMLPLGLLFGLALRRRRRR